MNPVVAANQASSDLIAQKIGETKPQFKISISNVDWHIQIRKSRELTTNLKKECFEIFEDNMRETYNKSSNGYNVKEKKKELFHRASKFMLISSASEINSMNQKTLHSETQQSGCPLAGFLMWRFDFEETLTDEMVEVVYCYEIQVRMEAKGKGLGKALMKLLEAIARGFSIPKLMLTVHQSNKHALQFYKVLGFSPDEICPSQVRGAEEADYQILFKTIQL
ncbi:hypothetical protein O181_022868 [Austropuccinia psidii MF-1]|uniref:N-alpha-acetyltransferase 40 n=1 Tax=Austropuccinia psidii MF-1 TaxID=1389203 RepID=A0A9Q3CG12_9BASI|nr:hypothetical protein [Austropuccinia psidii MF-1]